MYIPSIFKSQKHTTDIAVENMEARSDPQKVYVCNKLIKYIMMALI